MVFLFAKHWHCAYLCGQVQTESLSQHIYIKEFDLEGAQHLLKIFSFFFQNQTDERKVTKDTTKEKKNDKDSVICPRFYSTRHLSSN